MRAPPVWHSLNHCCLMLLLCRWAWPFPPLRAFLWRLSALMPAWPWLQQCQQRWTAGTYGRPRLLCSRLQPTSRWGCRLWCRHVDN